MSQTNKRKLTQNQKRGILIGIVILLALGIYAFFRPLPVITDDQLDVLSCGVTVDIFTPYSHDNDKTFTFDSTNNKEMMDAVLLRLSSCKVRRTLDLNSITYGRAVYMTIFTYGDEHSPSISVGCDGNIIVYSDKIFQRKVIGDTDSLIKDLETILGLDKLEQTDSPAPSPSVEPSAEPSPSPTPPPTTAEPAFFMGTEPLPSLDEETGIMKNDSTECKDITELFGGAPEFLSEEALNIETLPVYKPAFIYNETPVTDELKDKLRLRAKRILKSAGMSDLSELPEPNEEFLNDPYNPMYTIEIGPVSMNVLAAKGASISLPKDDFPDIYTTSEIDLIEFIKTNPWLNAACKTAGITSPKIYSKTEYTIHGDLSFKHVYIYEAGDNLVERVKNKTFSRVWLFTYPDADDVSMVITCDDMAEYIGDYKLVPYSEALETLLIDKDITEEDILCSEIVYFEGLNSKQYYIPYYSFYFEAEDENLAEGIHLYCQYLIRAVKDN